MEIFFAFVIKLTVIFLGSGIATLIAFYISKESSTIPKIILDTKQKEKTKLSRCTKISSQSALYEVVLPSNKLTKIFSSHKGMKVI